MIEERTVITKDVAIKVRLTTDQLEALEKEAGERGVSVSKIVRTAIDQYMLMKDVMSRGMQGVKFFPVRLPNGEVGFGIDDGSEPIDIEAIDRKRKRNEKVRAFKERLSGKRRVKE